MKTILLIDDDEDEFLIFSEVLEILALPLTCTYFTNASAAQVWLNTNTVDFIMIDMVMPKINGIEVLQKLKQLSNTKKSEFAILSSYTDKDLNEKALAAGAATSIQKADTVTKLANEMSSFFSNYQL